MQITIVDPRPQSTMTEIFFGYYESPIDLMEVSGTTKGITLLRFVEHRGSGLASNSTVQEATTQVSQYFLGTRREFDLPILLQSTGF
jgi:methylated-DNA-[protein]-cysteine S-methyltransferase